LTLPAAVGFCDGVEHARLLDIRFWVADKFDRRVSSESSYCVCDRVLVMRMASSFCG